MHKSDLIIEQRISQAIHVFRNQKVLIDSEIAELYGVDTKRLNEQVKRNIDRFPSDFMFQLSPEEWNALKSEVEFGNWGGRRTIPYVFTEQGVAMLSSVLSSKTAIHVNISIMRVFVKMRQWSANYEDLIKKIDDLNSNQMDSNNHIAHIYKIIQKLMQPEVSERKPIGFR